ncbi:PLC-like phosphodiesterase [Rickenella mellea]|uniref:PLC-like phosphodiesterase n=1 Tax=Rickenella mellea TaxID=50990 RepID=A0A4Y7QPA0_9AGAM|nr:PLC-like phosphodiesterase [Rickenella mellea]
MHLVTFILISILPTLSVLGFPAQEPLQTSRRQPGKFYDIQAHRGGRGNTVENTIPSFAWGLIDGATTLELDNGITKDGVVVVWHDENIVHTKCSDTSPAFPGDSDYPYVGKYIANLTLAQLKTLDCGSKRQDAYPLQLTYTGTRISTLEEVFAFAECADPQRQILWNIESKIDALHPNRTLGVQDFVRKQYEIFAGSNYNNVITYQSFDWRTLIEMKKLNPTMPTSALVDDETAVMQDKGISPWLAGIDLSRFNASTFGERLAQAAHSIRADILSPSAESYVSPEPDPTMAGYIPFTTKEMVDKAHELGLAVKPWTINRLNIVEQLMSWHVDGIITDYPNVVRRWAKQNGFHVAPKYPKQRVLACLEQHTQT